MVVEGSALKSSEQNLKPVPEENPENIAVIMYTSGTTGIPPSPLSTNVLCPGVPKGVALSHRALLATIASTVLSMVWWGDEMVWCSFGMVKSMCIVQKMKCICHI